MLPKNFFSLKRKGSLSDVKYYPSILKIESFIDTPQTIWFCSVFKEEFSNWQSPLRGRTAGRGGQGDVDAAELEAEAWVGSPLRDLLPGALVGKPIPGPV